VRKFLPIFWNFFYYNKKIDTVYKLIQRFPWLFPIFAQFVPFQSAFVTDKKWLLFLNRLIQFTHVLIAITFPLYISIILYASAALFLWKQNKKQWRICPSVSIFNRTKSYDYVDIYDLSCINIKTSTKTIDVSAYKIILTHVYNIYPHR